jgi:hypothetical protein
MLAMGSAMTVPFHQVEVKTGLAIVIYACKAITASTKMAARLWSSSPVQELRDKHV